LGDFRPLFAELRVRAYTLLTSNKNTAKPPIFKYDFHYVKFRLGNPQLIQAETDNRLVMHSLRE
jgi:hypothetical protein